MSNQRTFHYITDARASSATGEQGYVQYNYEFNYSDHSVNSMDTFEDELILIAYPVNTMQHIDSILRHYGLNDNSYYFYQQVKELVALPEKHQNEKGEGKIDFQTFFHNVPYSFMSINMNAIVLIGLHPLKKTNEEGLRDYNLIGYIHANAFYWKPGDGKSYPSYYYNMLRVADKLVDGENIYRRKKLFTLFFSILNEICFINDVQFAYASMGRENVAINDALHKCATNAGIHYERLHYKIFGQINRLWGSSSQAGRLVDITGDDEKLKRFYRQYVDVRGKSILFQPETEAVFFTWVDSIRSYSQSSGIYAFEKNGEITAATFAINWSDYFVMLILNPKGLFKLVESVKLIQNILFPVMTIGEPSEVRNLFKGLAHKFRVEQQCQVSFLPSFIGDPYYKVKKGLLDDDFYYFIICRDKDLLQHYKDISRDADGNVWPFVDMPVT
jgi:hypothetical protein